VIASRRIPRPGRTTAQHTFSGRLEPFEVNPAAGALDDAVGSPRHYILRGLYGAVILCAGKIIARRRNLKEETCRTGS
jgi:hypothetical protein